MKQEDVLESCCVYKLLFIPIEGLVLQGPDWSRHLHIGSTLFHKQAPGGSGKQGDDHESSINNSSSGLSLILAKPPPAHAKGTWKNKKEEKHHQARHHCDSQAHLLRFFSSLPSQICRDRQLLQKLLAKTWGKENPKNPVYMWCKRAGAGGSLPLASWL